MAQLYKGLFVAADGQLDQLIFAFVGLYILSSVIFFLGLKRVVCVPAAICGALLYLAHAAKQHAVLAYNAEGYVLVILGCMAIGWCYLSGLPKFAKCLMATSILWATLHLYEILVVLAPVFPVVLLVSCIARRRKPKPDDLACAFAPPAVTAIHITVLATRPKPIWTERDQMQQSDILPRMLNAILDSGNSVVGPKHWQHLTHCIGNFFRYDLHSDLSLIAPAALSSIIVIAACSYLAAIKFDKVCAPRQSYYLTLLFFIGLYLLVFGGVTGAAVSSSEIPSRLLYLPTLGLATVVGCSLELIRRQARKPYTFPACVALMLIYCLCEATAFCDVVRQKISCMRFDTSLTRQLRLLHPNKPEPGERFFLSRPFDRRALDYWLDDVPEYVWNDSPTRLAECYKLPLHAVSYYNFMRSKNDINPNGLHTWMKKELKRCAPNQLEVLYLDDNQVLHAVSSVTTIKNDGTFIRYRLGSWNPAARSSALNLSFGPYDF